MKTQNFGTTHFPAYFYVMCSFLVPFFHVPFSLAFLAPAQKNYRENRENGNPIDNPKQPFPSAGFDQLDIKTTDTQSGKWPDASGRYWWKLTLNNGQVLNDFYWMKDEARGFPDKSDESRYWFTVGHTNGTKMEGFSQEPDYQKGFPDKDKKYWRYIQFTDTHCPTIRQWMEEKDRNYLARIKEENHARYHQEMAELIAVNPTHPAIIELTGEPAMITELSSDILPPLPIPNASLLNDLSDNRLILCHASMFGQSSQPNAQEVQNSTESTDSTSCCLPCRCHIM